MKLRGSAALIPAVALLAFAVPAGAATSGSTTEAVSENWAGYEATPTSSSGFSADSGSWTQPTVSASSTGTYSAYWVGLGGGGESSTALEQEGTQADVSASGKVSYYAWYELVPAAPVKIKSVTVHPGDRIWARTSVSGDKVTVEVDNKTTGQDFKKTLTMSSTAPDTSTAEWVAEAPSECQGGASGQCQPLTLSNFGSVKFTNAYATSGGQTKSVSGWTDTAIALSPASSASYGYGGGYGGGFGAAEATGSGSASEGAAPGSLSSDGSAFTVTYGSDASATGTSSGDGTSTASGGASGYGYGSSGTSGYGGSGTSGYGGSGTSGYGGSGTSGYGGSGTSGYGGSGTSGYGGSGTSGYAYGVPGSEGDADSGDGDSGYSYGYGASGDGDSGYGYSYYGISGTPYVVTESSYPSESYYSGADDAAGAVYGY